MSDFKKNIRRAIRVLALLLLFGAGAAKAEQAPLGLILGYAAGGPMDVLVRTLANVMRLQTDRQVLVMNRPGAAGATAANSLVNEVKDGNTLLIHNNYFQSESNARLVPVLQITETSLGIWSKSGRMSGGTIAFSGTASGYMFIEVNKNALNQWMRTDVNPIPYRGTAAALSDTAAGNADYFMGELNLMEQATQLGLTLIATSSMKAAQQMGQPALGRAIPNMQELVIPVGVFAPEGVIEAILSKLRADFSSAVSDLTFVDHLKRNQFSECVCTADSLVNRMNGYSDIAARAINTSNDAGTIPKPFRMTAASTFAAPIPNQRGVIELRPVVVQVLGDDPKVFGRSAVDPQEARRRAAEERRLSDAREQEEKLREQQLQAQRQAERQAREEKDAKDRKELADAFAKLLETMKKKK